MLQRVKFWLSKYYFCRLFHTERSWHAYWFSAVIVSGRRDLSSDARTFYLTLLKRKALHCIPKGLSRGSPPFPLLSLRFFYPFLKQRACSQAFFSFSSLLDRTPVRERNFRVDAFTLNSAKNCTAASSYSCFTQGPKYAVTWSAYHQFLLLNICLVKIHHQFYYCRRHITTVTRTFSLRPERWCERHNIVPFRLTLRINVSPV